MKVVISGEIGSGKSAAVREAMKQLGWNMPGGFFTHWDGKERGAGILYFETWSGEKHVLARRIAEPVHPGGLPYELDREHFTKYALASLSDSASERPIVIDELGALDLDVKDFSVAVTKLFHGPAPVLVVIQHRALKQWLDVIDPKNVQHLLQADVATRAALPAQLTSFFQF